MRCVHEAQLYDDNCFITLTYDDAHLPTGRTLELEEFQKFMKRLRFNLEPKIIRFFHCGEYGEKRGRPHYHALIFNHDFGDKKLWKKENEIPLYTSDELSSHWPLGFSSLGAITFQSASYVARYVMKKVTGELAANHYEWVSPETGEIFDRKPEYTTMSRRDGLGKSWYNCYKRTDIYDHDMVVLNGHKMRPPKYYDRLFEHENPQEMEKIKKKRANLAQKQEANNTPERLRVREAVHEAKLKQLPRSLK